MAQRCYHKAPSSEANAAPLTIGSLSRVALLASAAFLLLSAQTVGGQETDIDALVEAVRVQYNIPGLSLAVVANGSLLLAKGYGNTHADGTGDNVTADTLYFIASTGKAFTSVLLAQMLANSSKYTLDTPVREIMPHFHLSDLYRQEMTSTRDLLSHTTGVTDSTFNFLIGGDVNTLEEMVNRARFFSPVTPLRTRVVYNSLMYSTAGLLVEHIEDPPAAGESQLTYERAMTERIFAPLGMTGSSFMGHLSPAQEGLLVPAHMADWRDGGRMREVDASVFAKTSFNARSIVSSARDFAKWLLMLTNDGRNEAGVRVVNSTVLRETLTPQSIHDWRAEDTAPFEVTSETYGLGWTTGFYRGHRFADHSGYLYGYHAHAMLFPDLGLAVMSCANGQRDGGLQDLSNRISDVLLPQGVTGGAMVNERRRSSNPDLEILKPLINPHSIAENDVAEWERAMEGSLGYREGSVKVLKNRGKANQERPNAREYDEYVGTYGNFAMGNATVVLNETTGRLELQYGTIGRAELVNTSDPNHFIGHFADPLFFLPPSDVFFARTFPGGEVVNMTVPEFLWQVPPVFQRGLRMSDAPEPLEGPVCPVCPVCPPDEVAQGSRVRVGFVGPLIVAVIVVSAGLAQ